MRPSLSGSIPTFLSACLQLIHMHHFMEPLTVFAIDELLGAQTFSNATAKLQDAASLPFLDALLTRLHHPEKGDSDLQDASSPAIQSKWKVTDVQSILSAIKSTRTSVRMHARKSRLAFAAFRLVQAFLLRQGYKTADSGRSVLEAMSACLRGTLSRKDGRWLAAMVKCVSISFFNRSQVHDQLSTIGSYLQTSSAHSLRKCISSSTTSPPRSEMKRNRRG